MSFTYVSTHETSITTKVTAIFITSKGVSSVGFPLSEVSKITKIVKEIIEWWLQGVGGRRKWEVVHRT